MKRLTKILALTALFLFAAMAEAQVTNPSVRYVAVAPSGACSQSPPVQVLNSSGAIYTCNNGTWAIATGSGSGTVTDGAGTTTPGLVAQSTGTAHVQTYSNTLGTTTLEIGQGILDADLTTGAKVGGGTATDNTALINGLLAAGSTTAPVSIYLTGGTVDRGIHIPAVGNVKIQGRGWRDGFFTLSGSNAAAISNATSSDIQWWLWELADFPLLAPGGTPALTNVGSVTLSDFMINGNRGVTNECVGVVDCTLSSSYVNSEKGYRTLGPPSAPNIGAGSYPSSPATGVIVKITNGSTNTDCTTRAGAFVVFCYYDGSVWTKTTTTGVWYTGIDLFNLRYVRVSNVRVLDSPTYAFRLGNVSSVVIEDSTAEQSAFGVTFNHDGFHVDGPANDLTLRNVTCINIDDDCIALNEPEGWSGVIQNVVIDGARFANDYAGVRLLEQVENVSIVNSSGTLNAFLLQVTGGYPTTSGTIRVSNSHVMFTGGGGGNGLVNFNCCSPLQNLIVTDTSTAGPGVPTPWINVLAGGGSIDNIDLTNDWIEMTSDRHAATAGVVAINTGSSVGKLTLNGFFVLSPSGYNYTIPEAVNMAGGTLGELVVNAINPTNITALVNSWTGISRVSGSGLLASGYKIPDSIVVNGVPYVSASSGQASIKLGGTANGVDGTVYPLGLSVADTTVVVSSGTQGANSCSSPATVSMTGLTTSMVALVNYSASPSALTGWGSTGGMVFQAWPSAADTMSWIVCNQTGTSITYSAVTFNVGAR